MKPNFKSWLRIAAAVAAIATATTAMADTTVRMWTFLNPDGKAPREVALKKIITNFETANPDVKIVVEPQVWDQMTPKFLAANATGNAPDIIWVVTDFLGDAIKSGSLADLNPLFIDKWSPDRVKDNGGAYWDLTSVDGKQYAIFASRNYIALMYRKDFLADAGIDPTKFATWDDFREAAKKLTVKDASGNVTRYGYAVGLSDQQSDPPTNVPLTLASGDKLFNDDGTANFASPGGVKAMTFLTDMITKDGSSPKESTTWTVDDSLEQFAAGRLAMVQAAVVRVSTVQGQIGKDKVGFAMWPGNGTAEHSPAVMAGWAVGIWSGSKVKDAAAKFTEYMMGPEGDAIWVENGGQVPGLLSTLQSEKDLIAQPGNEYLSVAAEGASKYGWLTPVGFSVGGYRQALDKAAQKIVVDGTDVTTALKQAEAEFNAANGH